MKIDLTSADLPENVCCGIGRQSFDYDLFNEADIAEVVKMCDDYTKLGGHTHLLYSVVKFSFLSKTVFASMNRDTFENTDYMEQEPKNLSLVRRRNAWFTCDSGGISLGTLGGEVVVTST